MPGTQEMIALGIVALVAGRLIWRRVAGRRAASRASACGDCASSGPPPKEATVHFHRKRGSGKTQD